MLDKAIDDFKAMPTSDSAKALIEVATEYWNDAMISDIELSNHLRDVADWLAAD